MLLRFLTLRSPDVETPAGGTPPVETPVRPSIADAIAGAKARLAAGEPVIPAPGAPPVVPAGEPAPVVTPPVETPAGEPVVEVEPVVPPAVTPPAEPTPTEFVIPALAEGDEPIPLDIPDEALRGRLAQIVERAEQVTQLEGRETQLVAQQAELEQFEDALAVDPLVVIMNGVDPEVQTDLALAILAQPGVWAKMKDVLAQLDNPDKAEALRSRVRERRSTMKETLEKRQDERKATRKSEKVVTTSIERIAASLPKGKRDTFGLDALKAVAAYHRRTGNNRIAERDVPVIIADVCATYGVDPVTAAALLRGEARKVEAGRVAPPTPPVLARRTTPEQALAAEAQRKSAAAAAASSSVAAPKVTDGLASAAATAKKGDFKSLFQTLRIKAGLA